jgi:predicted ATPase
MTWNVITAGPSAGKSSVIRELSARGYRTAPEGARIVLDQLVSEGTDPKEYRENHPQAYQDKVLSTDFRIQDNMPENTTVFMDRSIADNLAYARLTDRNLPDWFDERYMNQYDNIFRLEQIGFEDDYARTEDEEMAESVHAELLEVYEGLGYDVIDVPLEPVDERADFILDRI